MSQDSFTVTDLVRITHLHRATITRQIHAGLLHAERKTGPASGNAFRISRKEVMRWLLSTNRDRTEVRRLMNHQPWILTLGLDKEFHNLLGGYCIDARSFTGLGQWIAEHKAWAILIDLPRVGSAEAIRECGELARDTDRPELIGLYGDDWEGVKSLTAAFDVLLPRSKPRAELARLIHNIRYPRS